MCSRSARARMDSRPSARSASMMSRSVSSIGAMCPAGRSAAGSLGDIWPAYRPFSGHSSLPSAVTWKNGNRSGHDRERNTLKGGTMPLLADTLASDLLPSATPLQLIDPDGHPGGNPGGLELPVPDVLRQLHRRMVLGRRFEAEATVLARQGRLAVYPSARGQEACQAGAVLALRDQDWLFPTYRDSAAVLTRGVDPGETLTLLRRDWHCGYDPYLHHR